MNRKTVLITGCGGELGKATALYFSARGWNVAATMREPSKWGNLTDIPNLRVIALDLTKPDTILQAFDDAIAYFGAVDVVVNNVNVGLYGALELLKEEDIDRQIALNLRGVLRIIRAALPHFRENRNGMFINVGSAICFSKMQPLASLCNLSRFALEGLTQGLYCEMSMLNIKVHLIWAGCVSVSHREHIILRTDKRIREYDRITSRVNTLMNTASRSDDNSWPDSIVCRTYQLATGRRKNIFNRLGTKTNGILLLEKLLPKRHFLSLMCKRFLD